MRCWHSSSAPHGTRCRQSAPKGSPRLSARGASGVRLLVLLRGGRCRVCGRRRGRATNGGEAPSTVTFVAKTHDPQPIMNARFMPDGQTIVYSAAPRGFTSDFFIIRPDSEAPQPLGVSKAQLLSVSSKGELTTALHEVWGYLSDVRVSPDGSRVAVFEHQWQFDDRGWVKVVDLGGHVTTLAGEYMGMEGLAWTPDGATIVFSANDGGGVQCAGLGGAGLGSVKGADGVQLPWTIHRPAVLDRHGHDGMKETAGSARRRRRSEVRRCVPAPADRTGLEHALPPHRLHVGSDQAHQSAGRRQHVLPQTQSENPRGCVP